MNLVDGDNSCRIGCPNDVAGIDQPGSRAAFDRRTDAAVIQLYLRHVDHGLVGFDACFELRNQSLGGVALLGGSCTSLGKSGKPIQIETRVVQLCLILELVGLRLGQRRCKWRRVDLDQHLAGMNVLTLGKIDLNDLTVYPRSREHAVEGLNRAEACQKDRDIRAPDLARHDRDGRCDNSRAGWRARRP
jgi:hypothetical protein